MRFVSLSIKMRLFLKILLLFFMKVEKKEKCQVINKE